jgi:hypothetical protein
LSAGTLESWTGSEEAKAWSKVGAETWEYLMAKAGAEDAQMVVIVGLPIHAVVDLLRMWVDDLHPPYAELVKAALPFNVARLMFGLELADFLHPPTAAPVILPAAPVTTAAVPTVPGVKIKLSRPSSTAMNNCS